MVSINLMLHYLVIKVTQQTNAIFKELIFFKDYFNHGI